MDKKEIYLPWRNFNNNESELYKIKPQAAKLASEIHPIFNKLTYPSKKLHARNMYQVLGYDLNKPSDILVCWTKDGCNSEKTATLATGGTRSAIVLADRCKIPIFNVKNDDDYEKLLKLLEDEEKENLAV